MKPIQYLAIGLLLSVASCKEIEKPVTQQEASVFAQSIVKSLAKKDPKIYNEAMDLNLLAERITSRNKQRSSSYWNGLKQGLRGAINFGTKILDGLGQNGTYSLVRQYEKEGKQHLLFRFFAATGFNYHDVELAHKNDQVKIADVYVYTTGEYFSETLERLFAQTKDKDNYYYLKELSNLNEMVKNGQYQRVKNKIDEMPPNLRALKSVQISYIVVCSNISDSAHRLAIERYERDFPNDPSLNIVLIDGYFVKKEYDKALQCVNKLDQQLGSDPFLDYYRGLLYKQMGNREEAFSVLKRLYRNVPTFSMGALELSALYLDEGDNENAASIIRSTQQNRDYDPSHVQYLCSLYPQLKPLVEQ